MDIPKMWDIDFACGHSQEIDLSQKRIDQRAGYAKWLEQRDCFDCFKSKGTKKVSKEREKERAEELENVAVQEKRDGLLPLSGSDKQQVWARSSVVTCWRACTTCTSPARSTTKNGSRRRS